MEVVLLIETDPDIILEDYKLFCELALEIVADSLEGDQEALEAEAQLACDSVHQLDSADMTGLESDDLSRAHPDAV